MQWHVKSITVDKKIATVVLADGSIQTLNQGDAKLARLLEKALIDLKVNGEAIIDFDEPVEEVEESTTILPEFEKKSNGFVRFFRAAKAAVKHFFQMEDQDDYSDKPVEPKKPVMAVMPTVFEESAKPPVQQDKGMYAPIEEPTEEPKAETPKVLEPEQTKLDVKPLDHDSISDNETVVAVLADGRVVPDAHKLKAHIAHAMKYGQEEGIKALITRVAAMGDKRAHSVEDLLEFMRRGDMPVTNTGEIIAYKMLNIKPGTKKEDGIFVDCHTGKVQQRVGSYVTVREDLVDKNRRNECSNGLHVARRSYLKSFSGHVCTMIIVAPEDVITVPHGDSNKVRTMGYQIVALLPDEAKDLLRADKEMTSIPAMKELLASVIKGDYIARKEIVQINGQYGADVVITPIGSREERKEEFKPAPVTTEEVEKAEAVTILEEKAKKIIQQETAAHVDIRSLNKAISAEVSEVEMILAKKDVSAAQTLVEKKRKQKKSWEKMGVGPSFVQPLLDLAATNTTETAEPVVADVVVAPEPQIANKAPKEPVLKQDEAKEPNFRDNAIAAITLNNPQLAAALVAQKRKAKKAWSFYGLDEKQAAQLIEVAGNAASVEVATSMPAPEPKKKEPKAEVKALADKVFPLGSKAEFKEALLSFELNPTQAEYDRLAVYAKSKKKSLQSLGMHPVFIDKYKPAK